MAVRTSPGEVLTAIKDSHDELVAMSDEIWSSTPSAVRLDDDKG
jgi:hypothetical protein